MGIFSAFFKGKKETQQKSKSSLFYKRNLLTQALDVEAQRFDKLDSKIYAEDCRKYITLLFEEGVSENDIQQMVIEKLHLPAFEAKMIVQTTRVMFSSEAINEPNIEKGSESTSERLIEALVDFKLMGESDEEILKRILDIGFDRSAASSLLFMIKNAAEAKSNLSRINKSKY